jgi:peptide/nickel transport system permease protein
MNIRVRLHRCRSWRKFRRKRLGVLSLVVIVLMYGLSLSANVWVSHDPEEVDILLRFAGPSWWHLFGTDEMGRDAFARIVYGGRVSLSVGTAAMVLAITLGSLVGAVAGFWGGAADAVLMRITESMLSIPVFFFVIVTLAILGSSLMNVILVISLTSWMATARIVRSEVLRNKELDYVMAARVIGCSGPRVLFRHALPQVFPSIIVSGTLGVAYAILIESALSFLGLGVQPPTPSWGNMLTGAQSYLWKSPMLVVYPGALIFLCVLMFNALGDGLRDALDPTMR